MVVWQTLGNMDVISYLSYTLVMKTAISVPDKVFEAADNLANRLGLSRSALYAQAVAEFLERHREDGVTAELNKVYSTESSELDPLLHEMQAESNSGNEW